MQIFALSPLKLHQDLICGIRIGKFHYNMVLSKYSEKMEGLGVLFHSLRVTPPIVEICDDINAICPNAFVFNYTNPMQRVCQTVTKKYPEMKFVGLCHEIASMERQLPDIMNTLI